MNGLPDNPPSTPPPKEGLLRYLLLALLATAGFFYVNIAAAIVEGLVSQLGFTNAEAGAVMSANIYGASLGCLVAVFVVRRWRWRPTLLLLFGVLLVLDLISIAVKTPLPLLALRAVHGVIGGISVGVALALMARTQAPDRAFGMLLVLQFGLGGLGMMWLPTLVAKHGAWVLFVTLASLTLAALATTALLRLGAGAGAARGEVAAPLDTGARWLAGAALLALFLFQAGNMALFAFIIQLGQAHALTLDFISQALAWATWIGAFGAVLVVVMGARAGRLRPLLAAMLVTLIGIAGLYWSRVPLVFFATNVGTAITWSFVVPYLFGIVSSLDRSGRLATLAGFISKLGLASGPLLAGLVAGGGNLDLLIGIVLLLLLLSAIAALVAAQRVDRLAAISTSRKTGQ